jgi:hypothetical protein
MAESSIVGQALGWWLVPVFDKYEDSKILFHVTSSLSVCSKLRITGNKYLSVNGH